jgi:4-hydroxy-3-methylbut-2-en-1-yl diphosphate reductase
MHIVLANPRGFCAGVNRAIAIVHQALEQFPAPIYVLHEIVHNTHVIAELTSKGAVFVEHLDEIPSGSVAIFSAHGVSRHIIEQATARQLHTIDATCPLVSKVHRRVSRLNKIGYDVLVIGHKGHPEVVGTCGHADGAAHVVSTVEEIPSIRLKDQSRVGYVTQTTLSVDDTQAMIEAIRQRFPDIKEPERTDICYATTNRQTAVLHLAGRVDLVLIVGSKNSSNSNRLREVALKQGIPAYLIDDAGEIEQAWLTEVQAIGVSAGASAPEYLVAGVVERLHQMLGPCPVTEMEGNDESICFQVPDLNQPTAS